MVPEIVFCKQQHTVVRQAGRFHWAIIIPWNIPVSAVGHGAWGTAVAFRLSTTPTPSQLHPAEGDESDPRTCRSGSWRMVQILPGFPKSNQGLCSGKLWCRWWSRRGLDELLALLGSPWTTGGSWSPDKSHIHCLGGLWEHSLGEDGEAEEWLSFPSQSLPSQAYHGFAQTHWASALQGLVLFHFFVQDWNQIHKQKCKAAATKLVGNSMDISSLCFSGHWEVSSASQDSLSSRVTP